MSIETRIEDSEMTELHNVDIDNIFLKHYRMFSVNEERYHFKLFKSISSRTQHNSCYNKYHEVHRGREKLNKYASK